MRVGLGGRGGWKIILDSYLGREEGSGRGASSMRQDRCGAGRGPKWRLVVFRGEATIRPGDVRSDEKRGKGLEEWR